MAKKNNRNGSQDCSNCRNHGAASDLSTQGKQKRQNENQYSDLKTTGKKPTEQECR